jgi:drug/metabolite transporter (DMT)-like permease
MDWFFLALIPPFLWVCSTFIDKFLVSKKFQGKIGALMIFYSIISVIFAPLIYFFFPQVINIDLISAIIVVINSFFLLLYLYPYFLALERDDLTNVTPIFQTIPIFTLILSFFFLKESLSFIQLIAMGIIIFGAFLITLRFSDKQSPLHKKGKIWFLFRIDVLFLMLVSSLIVAINMVVFKFFALEFDYWTIMFWQFVGAGIFGSVILIFHKKSRNDFFSIFHKTNGKILWMNIFNEIINDVAWMVFSFVSLLAPISLVTLVGNVFQPIIALFIGLGLTLFFPHINKEAIDRNTMIRKIIAIGVIIFGVILLGVTQ